MKEVIIENTGHRPPTIYVWSGVTMSGLYTTTENLYQDIQDLGKITGNWNAGYLRFFVDDQDNFLKFRD